MLDQNAAVSNPNTVPRKVRMPIRTKLTLPYLVLSLIVAVIAAYMITQLVVENVEDRFTKQLYEAGKISSELVVTAESKLLESLRLLANVDEVSTAITANDSNRLRSLTFGIVANNQLDAVEFLDLQGRHILSVRHQAGGNPENYDFSSGGQTLFSSLEIVQNVISKRNDAKGDKFADLVKLDNGNFLYLSGPINDNQGNLTGVVLVGENLERMAEEMRAKTFAQITFYGLAGEIINSTLPFPQILTDKTAKQVLSFKDLSSTKRDLSNQRDFNSSNITFSEILGAFEVRRNYEIGVLGVALSRNALVQTSNTSRWQIFLLVAAANFLIILVGIYLANQITRPLLKLVQASKQVSEGDLSVKIPLQSNDEVTVLTESFNTMIDSLNRSQKDLLQSYDDTLGGWAKALELRDKETEGHAERVTDLTVRLAERLGIKGEELVFIRRGALLHDIGKMGTPDAILHKNGSLTVEERTIIQKHPLDAYNMLNKIGYLQHALEIPYCHHEKWNGTGYPRGLKGKEIPISARVFSIVDVYDAMSNDRIYRKALPRDEIFAYLRKETGEHFDPQIVDVFIQVLQELDPPFASDERGYIPEADLRAETELI